MNSLCGRISRLSLIVAGASIFQRDFDRKHRAAIDCVCRRQGATMLGDDPVRERQADAVAFWFGGEERSEEHTSELQSQSNLVCRLLLEKKKKKTIYKQHK